MTVRGVCSLAHPDPANCQLARSFPVFLFACACVGLLASQSQQKRLFACWRLGQRERQAWNACPATTGSCSCSCWASAPHNDLQLASQAQGLRGAGNLFCSATPAVRLLKLETGTVPSSSFARACVCVCVCADSLWAGCSGVFLSECLASKVPSKVIMLRCPSVLLPKVGPRTRGAEAALCAWQPWSSSCAWLFFLRSRIRAQSLLCADRCRRVVKSKDLK